MSIKVTSKGGDKFARRLEKMNSKFKGGESTGVQMALYKGGLMVERSAVENASGPRPKHIDRVTGELASRINTQRSGKNKVTVGIKLEYAAIHEFGGMIKQDSHQVAAGGRVYEVSKVIHMPARPYLRPALDSNRGQIMAYVMDYLRIMIRESQSGY